MEERDNVADDGASPRRIKKISSQDLADLLTGRIKDEALAQAGHVWRKTGNEQNFGEMARWIRHLDKDSA